MSEPMPGAEPAQQDERAPLTGEPGEEAVDTAVTADAATTAAGTRAEDLVGADGPPGDAGEDGGEDEGPRPLGPRVTPTGHAPVDAVLRRLEDADHLAVSGHLEVYEDVHRGLRDTLTALDRPAPGAGPVAHGRPVPGPQHTRS